MPNRIARAAAALSLALTAVLILRIIAIGKPGVFVILIPALTGALLAIWRHGRIVLIASALLTAATASVLLIGGIGLLYAPSLVMFVWAAISTEVPKAARGTIGH
jgi:hypothetical protein